jgi:hypothetical protein
MADMHPDAQVVMAGFQAFAEGDVEGMRSLFADDAVWHAPGRNRFSGDFRGPDEILGLFADLSAAGTIDNRPHGLLADDDHVVVLAEATFQRDGESLDANSVFVFHVDDGKVTEAWVASADQYELDEFWGS